MNFAPRIIERREDKRLPEQAVVELVFGVFVVTVQPHLQSGREFLA